MNTLKTFMYPYKGMVSEEILKVSEILSIQFLEYEKDYIFPGEYQEQWGLIYVDQGHIRLNADNRQQPIHLKKGQCILLTPKTRFTIQSSNLKRFSLFKILFNVSNEAEMEGFTSNFIYPYSRYRYEAIREIIRESQRAFRYPLNKISFDQFHMVEEVPYGSKQMIFAHLERLLINLKRECLNDTGIPLGDESLFEGLNIVEETVSYLKHHLFDKISLDDISAHLDISKSYLQKIFVTATGKTVMRHLRELRISEAKYMILYEDVSMSEISEMLCFSSIHHFSSCFKQIEGVPPTKYYEHIRKIRNGEIKGSVEIK